MKVLGLTIVLLLVGMKSAQAEHYETYAFGDSEVEACVQVKSQLTDWAILKCRMNGGLFEKADYGECRATKNSRGRYEAVRSVEYSCKQEE
jgi:hypothetical protein